MQQYLNNFQGQKIRVTISMVDPTQRLIHAQTADKGSVSIAVFEVASAFRWPQVGEVWTVTRQNHVWILGSRVNADQAENMPITNLSTDPQLRLDGDTIFDSNGNQLLPYTSLRSLGAAGDGVTDDTQAFVQAFNSTGTIKGSAEDSYVISAGILARNKQNLILDLNGASIIINTRVGLLQNNNALFYLKNCNNIVIKNGNLTQQSPFTGFQDINYQIGTIVFDGCYNCSIIGWQGTSSTRFLEVNNSTYCQVRSNQITNSGITLTGASNYNTIQDNFIISGSIQGPTTTQNRFLNNIIQNLVGATLNGNDLIIGNTVAQAGTISLQGTTHQYDSTLDSNQATIIDYS